MSSDPNDRKKKEVGEEKTSVVASDTLKLRLTEAVNAPPTLVLLMGPPNQVGKQWQITKTEMFIGRAVESHIFVDDKSVSRKHAQVLLDGNTVSIIDLNSANGTEVSGNIIPVSAPRRLMNNEQIKTGNVIFKYLEQGNIESVSHQMTFDSKQLDALTQIYNRGGLIVSGNEYFKKAKLLEMPLTVIVFDLDNFKNVNDNFGHPVGDYVLRELASVVKHKLIRREDYFARYGGEEFCLILFGGDLRRGVEVAERIRQTIEKHDFNNRGTSIPVTISAGVATLDPAMNSWDELFEKADQAAYLSKKGGKNRVSTI